MFVQETIPTDVACIHFLLDTGSVEVGENAVLIQGKMYLSRAFELDSFTGRLHLQRLHSWCANGLRDGVRKTLVDCGKNGN